MYLFALSVLSFPFFCVPSLHAVEYHVAETGADAGVGSAASPWRTVSHAATQTSPGDTVWVHEGRCNERLIVPVSGTSANYISFRAVAGENVVLDGSGLPVLGFAGLVYIADRSFIRVEGWAAYEADAASGPQECWGDPWFQSIANRNFDLQDTSPAINHCDATLVEPGDRAMLSRAMFRLVIR